MQLHQEGVRVLDEQKDGLNVDAQKKCPQLHGGVPGEGLAHR